MEEVRVVILMVRHLTHSEVWRILGACPGITFCSVQAPDADGYRRVEIRAYAMEACQHCEMSLMRAQMEALLRRVQGAGFMPRDDCVVATLRLSNGARMKDNGRAVWRHHPDNQMIIRYPKGLDHAAMGGNRSEVFQWICTVSDVESMEAVEQGDTVAVSVRFLHDDYGEVIGDVYRPMDEIVDLCFGARGLNLQAIEARRTDLRLEARGRLEAREHGEDDSSEDDESVRSGWGRVRPSLGNELVLWNHEDVRSKQDGNPQL